MTPSKQLADLAAAEGFILKLAPERFSVPTREAVDRRARVLCEADGRRQQLEASAADPIVTVHVSRSCSWQGPQSKAAEAGAF